MGTSYHQEALRKQRLLERTHAARGRTMLGNGFLSSEERAQAFQTAPTQQQTNTAERPMSMSMYNSMPRQSIAENTTRKRLEEFKRVWRPSAQLASIERDNIQQLMHPYDFSTWETRKSLGINVVDGSNYYKPRPKSQIFRIPYYSSYVWS